MYSWNLSISVLCTPGVYQWGMCTTSGIFVIIYVPALPSVLMELNALNQFIPPFLGFFLQRSAGSKG